MSRVYIKTSLHRYNCSYDCFFDNIDKLETKKVFGLELDFDEVKKFFDLKFDYFSYAKNRKIDQKFRQNLFLIKECLSLQSQIGNDFAYTSRGRAVGSSLGS